MIALRNSVHTTEAWVREALDPDQLTKAKRTLGRCVLNKSTLMLLWGLRVYVLLMVAMIAFQVWHALHA